MHAQKNWFVKARVQGQNLRHIYPLTKSLYLNKSQIIFILTVDRSNVSLCDRQKALGMIDDETNTCNNANSKIYRK